jgi:hypothetical protein
MANNVTHSSLNLLLVSNLAAKMKFSNTEYLFAFWDDYFPEILSLLLSICYVSLPKSARDKCWRAHVILFLLLEFFGYVDSLRWIFWAQIFLAVYEEIKNGLIATVLLLWHSTLPYQVDGTRYFILLRAIYPLGGTVIHYFAFYQNLSRMQLSTFSVLNLILCFACCILSACLHLLIWEDAIFATTMLIGVLQNSLLWYQFRQMKRSIGKDSTNIVRDYLESRKIRRKNLARRVKRRAAEIVSKYWDGR